MVIYGFVEKLKDYVLLSQKLKDYVFLSQKLKDYVLLSQKLKDYVLLSQKLKIRIYTLLKTFLVPIFLLEDNLQSYGLNRMP